MTQPTPTADEIRAIRIRELIDELRARSAILARLAELDPEPLRVMAGRE